MKRNIVALFGACVVLMTSCDLDYTNNGTINPDNVWSDKNMISSFLTDIYGNMLPGWPVSANNTDEGMNGPTNMSQFARGQITIDNYTTNWGYGDGGTGGWYNALFNADLAAYYPSGMITTDMVCAYSSNVYDEFNVGPSTGGALTNTYNIIRFVARATDIIDQISKSSGATEDIRNRFIAETKTLRAFYMYTLLDWFGPVNVKLDPEKLMDNTIEPRPSLDTYVGYIEKDLNEALETTSFPEKYNADADNWGRMSKSIAYGIRMKLYMHQKQWAKAKADAEKLMSMGFSKDRPCDHGC